MQEKPVLTFFEVFDISLARSEKLLQFFDTDEACLPTVLKQYIDRGDDPLVAAAKTLLQLSKPNVPMTVDQIVSLASRCYQISKPKASLFKAEIKAHTFKPFSHPTHGGSITPSPPMRADRGNGSKTRPGCESQKGRCTPEPPRSRDSTENPRALGRGGGRGIYNTPEDVAHCILATHPLPDGNKRFAFLVFVAMYVYNYDDVPCCKRFKSVLERWINEQKLSEPDC